VSTPGDRTPPSTDDLDVTLPSPSTESPAMALVQMGPRTLGLAREHHWTDPTTDHDEPDDDEVIGVRAWGTSLLVPLRTLRDSRVIPTKPTALEDAGAMSTTALQRVREALATVTRGLEVVRDGSSWRIRDSDGNAQLKQDGSPTREASLMPGTEIKLAGQTLIAESARSIALRGFCTRLLGWGDDRAESVDHALRAIRLAASGRSVLMLRGSGDLVPVAHTIHRRTLGERAPFVVSDPRRRRNTRATVRNAANVELGVEAFRQASHGSLCVRARRPPPDFDDVLRLFREPHSTVRLTVCTETAISGRDPFALAAARIEIPSLEARRGELHRIVHEYVEDAIEALHAPATCLDADTIQWVLGQCSLSPNVTIPDIEKAAVRAVALRMTGGIPRAARLLGMAPVSLQRWLLRRQ
jgi:hypothetical protein